MYHFFGVLDLVCLNACRTGGSCLIWCSLREFLRMLNFYKVAHVLYLDLNRRKWEDINERILSNHRSHHTLRQKHKSHLRDLFPVIDFITLQAIDKCINLT